MMGQKSFTHMCTDPLMDRCLDRPIRKWRLKVGKLVLIPFVAGMLKLKYNFLPRNVAKTSTCAHVEDNILDQTCFGRLIITDDQSCKSHISVLQHVMYRGVLYEIYRMAQKMRKTVTLTVVNAWHWLHDVAKRICVKSGSAIWWSCRSCWCQWYQHRFKGFHEMLGNRISVAGSEGVCLESLHSFCCILPR